MAPVSFFLGHILLAIISILTYKAFGVNYSSKRKYLLPFLIFLQAWPELEGEWEFYIGDWPIAEHTGYRVHQGFYTFDTRQPVAGLIYYKLGPHVHLPTMLSFCDILLVSAFFSLLIYVFNLAFSRR